MVRISGCDSAVKAVGVADDFIVRKNEAVGGRIPG
jgi:hypothetical protein